MTKKRRRAQSRRIPVSVTPRDGGGIALEVGGVVQSVSVPRPGETSVDPIPIRGADETRPGPGDGYWELLLPPACPAHALLLGLGGGTVAHLLAQRCPTAAIVGIEYDTEVLAVARAQFGLDSLPQLTIVQADAFAWVAEQCVAETIPPPKRYDLICLDLFQAGRLVPGTLATPFLRQVAQLLMPQGVLTVNLMATARTPEQLHRLERVFVLVRQLRLRGNLVVHAQMRDNT